ncbi:hypothetical protein [Actinomadura sp. 6K520]|uniref:hypothetical protein n=1 Tax=Actinomadura sp. 6K520 TaxID=2530364 RepID=UPI00104EE0EE|nr:hypothetical protein [Actinomadura sp. 6K520]TDE32757.1 hypothetical protein E1289_14590 [Actinomadura sp. 6K520]
MRKIVTSGRLYSPLGQDHRSNSVTDTDGEARARDPCAHRPSVARFQSSAVAASKNRAFRGAV